MTYKLDARRGNPTGMHLMTGSALLHVQRLSSAADSGHEVEGATILQIGDLFVPVLCARALFAATQIGTRNKALFTVYLQVRLKRVALIRPLGRWPAIHEEHTHGARGFGQPAMAVLGNRAG